MFLLSRFGMKICVAGLISFFGVWGCSGWVSYSLWFSCKLGVEFVPSSLIFHFFFIALVMYGVLISIWFLLPRF